MVIISHYLCMRLLEKYEIITKNETTLFITFYFNAIRATLSTLYFVLTRRNEQKRMNE